MEEDRDDGLRWRSDELSRPGGIPEAYRVEYYTTAHVRTAGLYACNALVEVSIKCPVSDFFVSHTGFYYG